MELLLFLTAVTLIVIGLVIYSKVKDASDELKLLRQDVFKVSVDLAKLQTRLDDLV
jgi:hypothetical protein